MGHERSKTVAVVGGRVTRALLAAAAVGAGRTEGAHISAAWTGATGVWSSAAKWSPGTVYPDNGNGNTFDVTLEGGDNVALDVSPTIQALRLDGGVLTTTGRLLTLKDRFHWTSGILQGGGTVNAEGGFEVSQFGDKWTTGAQVIRNFGPGVWAGDVSNEPLAIFINRPTGQVELRAGLYNEGIFSNEGTLAMTNGGSFRMRAAEFRNNGTVRVDAGTLALEGAGSHGGTFGGTGRVEISANQTFRAGSRVEVGEVVVRGSASTTTVDGFYGAERTEVQAGHLAINGPQGYGPAARARASSTFARLTFNTDARGTGSANLAVQALAGGAVSFATRQHLRELSVSGGSSTATITPGGVPGSKLVATRSLVVDEGGRVNVNEHAVVVDHDGGASTLGAVRNHVVSAYAGGTWEGPGVGSWAAALSGGRAAVGYAEASDVLGIGGAQTARWLRETVDATSVLIRYTLAGDADLDGAVGFDDLVRLAQNYDQLVPAGVAGWWSRGDFTYDGKVDFADLVRLAQNYGDALPPLPDMARGASGDFARDVAVAFASVPEPSGAVAALLALAGVGARRRRSQAPGHLRRVAETAAARRTVGAPSGRGSGRSSESCSGGRRFGSRSRVGSWRTAPGSGTASDL
jgi:MYXO-CTERM domain-containing protein